MAGVTLTGIREQEIAKQPAGSFSDMVFGFLDDVETIPQSFIGSASPELEEAFDEDQEQQENQETSEDKKINFWESQHQLLQSTLCRTSSLESKIRNSVKQALKEIQLQAAGGGGVCACGRQVASGVCRSCLMREVSGQLRNSGYNSAICKSKWRSSPDIPSSGEHTFMDVIDDSSAKKGEVIITRVIIELNFRAEFEMAKASEKYNRLVSRLPEVFVGKVERLSSVIKILCSAAKKCMKEKKMHMGPWRKQRYMQAKWLGTCERTTSVQILSTGRKCDSDRLPKPNNKARASMLTVDLLEKLPTMHCTAVKVV